MNSMLHNLFFMVVLVLVSCNVEQTAVIKGHAHNDYEHQRPFYEAYENGYVSFEADVHLVDDAFYVYHDLPERIDSTKTLANLYLKPMRKIVEAHDGFFYPGYRTPVFLMIDVKTDAVPAYPALLDQLRAFSDILVNFNKADAPFKPVKIVVTGHHGRPYGQILANKTGILSIDGRPSEVKNKITTQLMPLISQNYNKYLNYKGVGKPSEQDVITLSTLVKEVHDDGKRLRLWASPDNEKVWKFLLDSGVDLVNTDSLKQFKTFYIENYL